MRNLFRFLMAAGLLWALASVGLAQRPRSASSDATATKTTTTTSTTTTTTTAPAPQSVKAKYEGGVFGYNKKIDGTLSFDDTNRRLLFRDKTQKEVLFIPYDAVLSAYADVKSKRPVAADVASRVTIFALPAMLIKKKFQYLTLQFNDPDTHVSGVTSFKVENKDVLNSVLNTLVSKAQLEPRGEIYVKRKETVQSNP